MKKSLLKALGATSMLFFGLSNTINAQVYTIDQGGTVYTCSGTFYDSGDTLGDYQNNENHSITFASQLYGLQPVLDFTSFQLESCCDYVTIYDGTDATGNQLYYGNGTNSPGTVTSTTGSLHVTFTSDGSVTYPGWAADISCNGSTTADEVGTISASGSGSCGTFNYPITGEFWNGGTNDVNGLFVFYQINNNQPVGELIQDTILSGNTINYTFSTLADLSQPGTYNIAVWADHVGDLDDSNDTAYFTVNYAGPTVDLYDTTICDTATIQFNAFGAPNFVWYGGSSFSNPVSSTDMLTAHINSDTVFNVYESDTLFSVSAIYDTGSAVVDHNSLTGDDRGGIAVTQDFVYFVGDGNTARYEKDLTNGVSFARRDGIFSDLATSQLYSLWNTTNGEPVGTSLTGYTVDAIVRLDTDLTVIDTINLSMSFDMGGGYASNTQAGIYASEGYVILYSGTSGNNWYKVELPSGLVTQLGTFAFTNKRGNENWSHWGFAGVENGSDHVFYRQDATNNIAKINLTTQVISTVASFTNLSDMASIVVSPWEDRIYFHHESSSQFGGSSETGGYMTAQLFTGLGPVSACAAKVTVNVSDVVPNLGPDTAVCASEQYALNPGAFDAYSWSTGASAGVITPTTSGIYSVTTTDEFGCVKNDEVDLTVIANPALDLGSDTTICGNDFLELEAGSGMATYMWSNNSTDENLIVNSSGTYGVTISDANGCVSTDQIQVTAAPAPVVDLGGDTAIGAPSLITFDAGAGFSSYLWSTTETTQTIDVIVSSNQILSVTVTDANGCEGTDEVYIEALLSAENGVDNGVINIYPNPATSNVNIEAINVSEQEVEISLIDLTGRTVYTKSTVLNGTRQSISLEGLANGVYNLVIQNDEEQILQQQIVKQ